MINAKVSAVFLQIIRHYDQSLYFMCGVSNKKHNDINTTKLSIIINVTPVMKIIEA